MSKQGPSGNTTQLPPQLQGAPDGRHVNHVRAKAYNMRRRMGQRVNRHRFTHHRQVTTICNRRDRTRHRGRQSGDRPMRRPHSGPSEASSFTRSHRHRQGATTSARQVKGHNKGHVRILPLNSTIQRRRSSRGGTSHRRRPQVTNNVKFIQGRGSRCYVRGLKGLYSGVAVGTKVSGAPPRGFKRPRTVYPKPHGNGKDVLQFFMSLPRRFAASP